ncbi:hypothetical protein AWB85_02165 [Mycobacteroides immunogenum]|uniref:Lumazine-binding protein n=1 Tax=Mycobacteroides immunogenum TaxID=83262 RepID=A0A179VGC7_9MYCO|nr:hypothetical protein [Mycobacteroides immunogenum]OAT70202.1 hypothetical protein AWB85_02165 [Mycobacteroides immunogenum]
MTERDQPAGADDSEDRGSIGPFVAGAVIFGIVVIGIAVSTFFRSGDGLTDEGRVGQAVNAQNDALQRRAYADYLKATCRAVVAPEQNVIAAQDKSEAAHGNRFIDDVKDIKISADTATGSVTYHYTKSENDKLTAAVSFVKEDGSWRVCSQY